MYFEYHENNEMHVKTSRKLINLMFIAKTGGFDGHISAEKPVLTFNKPNPQFLGLLLM